MTGKVEDLEGRNRQLIDQAQEKDLGLAKATEGCKRIAEAHRCTVSQADFNEVSRRHFQLWAAAQKLQGTQYLGHVSRGRELSAKQWSADGHLWRVEAMSAGAAAQDGHWRCRVVLQNQQGERHIVFGGGNPVADLPHTAAIVQETLDMPVPQRDGQTLAQDQKSHHSVPSYNHSNVAVITHTEPSLEVVRTNSRACGPG